MKETPRPSADPGAGALGEEQLKSSMKRVALILLGVWLVGGIIYGMLPTARFSWVALAVPALLTVVVVGVLVWTLRRAKSARAMAQLLSGVETAEDRKAAIEQLSQSGKKNDPAAVFAKAQLEMQEDPRRALQTLESLDLKKLLGPVADEARAQRALVHLTLGEVSLARQLVDNIDLKRATEARSRAMLGAICAEAWSRSGDAKKALDTLSVFDPRDEALAQVEPQLLRAYAFSYASATKTKDLKRVLRRMVSIDPRLLGGFLQGKTHPLLAKEAKRTLEQSGLVPKRMQVQRFR